MTSYAPGAPITITATVDNAEGDPVPDTLSWTTSAGTLTTDDTTLIATITGAPLGDVTVSCTDPAGLTATITVTVADQTPASITLAAS